MFGLCKFHLYFIIDIRKLCNFYHFKREPVKLKAFNPLCPFRVPRRHVVDTDIHFYHVPSHADASRKRITEDTEDWRPRGGTTQSRSFRILAQITGTEHGELTHVSIDCCLHQDSRQPPCLSNLKSVSNIMVFTLLLFLRRVFMNFNIHCDSNDPSTS